MSVKNLNIVIMNIKIAGYMLGLVMFAGCDGPIVAQAPVREHQQPQPEFLNKTVIGYNGTARHKFVNNFQLYSEGWDTLPQAKFWQSVISLSHDSMIMNVADIRKPLYTLSYSDWHCQTETEKDCYKKNLCISKNIDVSEEIYVTSGKKFFFEYKKVLPMISKALPVFENNNTDPWFAQTILLIESPGKTEARSYVGARGPFQLMPYVARTYGLVVNKYRDDRTDLEKSAAAAAKLISRICIPHAKRILDEKGISYNEKDLWFRLFVMHIYHAGAGNVAAVINKINPSSGGMDLITTMWQSQAKGFKNESQNYSQIALASIINFDRLISQDADTVYLVQGDKQMRAYKNPAKACVDTLGFLYDCLSAYDADLVDGSIPFDYFATQVARVITEIEKYNLKYGYPPADFAYRESERLHNLGNELMYKRKFNEAIAVFQLGIQKNPISPATYDSLGRAYRLIGNTELASKYTKKSKEVIENPAAFLR
jgi:tetratricopeptide (TPR) repeat protein